MSLLLAAQCLALSAPLSSNAAWAADETTESAPSWNEFKSDSSRIIEGGRNKSIAASKSATGNADAAVLTPALNTTSAADTTTAADTTLGAPASVEATISSPSTVATPSSFAASVTAPSPVPDADVDNDGSKATNFVVPATATPAGPVTSMIGSPLPGSPAPASNSNAEIGLKIAPRVGSPDTLGTSDSLSGDMLHALGATVNVQSKPDADGTISEDGVLVLDCDAKDDSVDEVKYSKLEMNTAGTHIKTGAVFPVVISSQLSSKTSKKGDAVEARLKYDLRVGDKLVARKGAEVHGHINYSLKARPAMRALISHERWYRNSGCIGLEFDEIVNEKGEHLPLVASPARASRIVNNKHEGRLLGVNKDGQIACPSSQQWRDRAIRVGIHAALAPAGVFSFGAVPIALGLYGAANPSFAFMKPVGDNVRHRRIKGFAWGFISGVPGGMIIEDSIVKGQETIIQPGDEFLAEFHQEFNGVPSTDAQIAPDATTKVHGEVFSESAK